MSKYNKEELIEMIDQLKKTVVSLYNESTEIEKKLIKYRKEYNDLKKELLKMERKEMKNEKNNDCPGVKSIT